MDRGHRGASTELLAHLGDDRQTGLFKAGHVVRDGEVIPAEDVDVVLHIETDGLTIRGGTASATLIDGTTVEIVIDEPLPMILLPTGPYVGAECACRVTVDGLSGVADFETTNNAFGGSAIPEHTVRCVTTDGLTHVGAMSAEVVGPAPRASG